MSTHSENFSESCLSKLNLDCNYTFPIDSAPNGIPLGVTSIGNLIDHIQMEIISAIIFHSIKKN